MPDAIWWILSSMLIVLGFAGTVLPVLPGTALVLAGIVLGAWIDEFTRVGVVPLIVVAVLAALAWVLDFVAAALGARRVGASRQAVIGAAVGTVAGLAAGLVGVLVFPLVGAVLGEWWARRDSAQALRAGLGTWIGLIASLLAKLVLALMMVGVYLAALVY